MVCKETHTCPDEHGFLFPEEVIKLDNGNMICCKCESEVKVGRVEKMSKSKKNVIDPDILLQKYGADITRLFCLFAAPPEKSLEWSDRGVDGSYRFINRVWRLAYDMMDSIINIEPFSGNPNALDEKQKELYRKTHQTIKKVTNDIDERFHFNTAISAVMELVNHMYGMDRKNKTPLMDEVMRFAIESIILLLAPIVPHMTEEIWKSMGKKESVLLAPWPAYNEDALASDDILIVIQVNGKLRGRFNINADADDELIKERALSDDQITKFINDKTIKKVIVVKKKLVNIVV
jgi:leucyl-tRNA synthetase